MIEKYLVWRPLHHQFFHRHRPELALSIPGKAANNNNSGKSLNAFEQFRFVEQKIIQISLGWMFGQLVALLRLKWRQIRGRVEVFMMSMMSVMTVPMPLVK